MASARLCVAGLLLLSISTGVLGFPWFWESCDEHPATNFGQHMAPENDSAISFMLTPAATGDTDDGSIEGTVDGDDAAQDDGPDGDSAEDADIAEDDGADDDMDESTMDAVMTTWCPGVMYDLKVSYGEMRHSMVTASMGMFVQDADDEGFECEMKRKTNRMRLEEHTIGWTVPCPEDDDADDDGVNDDSEEPTDMVTDSNDVAIFQVSSATVPTSPYYQATATFNKSSDCAPCSRRR